MVDGIVQLLERPGMSAVLFAASEKETVQVVRLEDGDGAINLLISR